MNKLTTALASIAVLAFFGAIGPVGAQEKGLLFYGLQMEEFEYRMGEGGDEQFAWQGDAFVATDELKLRCLGEGEFDLKTDGFETLENRIVLQIPISTFFDLKGGVRVNTPKGADRWYAVLGVTGLAPQWFEVDADLFISEVGDASARLVVEYELLLTNYLILTPSAEANVAFSSDREIGVGSGLNDVEIGLRLGYDVIDRTFSPYVGVIYERSFGQAADLARDENEDTDSWRFAVGARMIF